MKRILIVEDDIISAISLQANLTDYGFDVEYDTSEMLAIQKIKNDSPDVLLLDINLNCKHDGIYIAETALSLKPHIQIIFITGYMEKSYSDRLKDIDFAAYLEKPLDFSQLLDVLRCMR